MGQRVAKGLFTVAQSGLQADLSGVAILHVVAGLGRGGTERFCYDLAKVFDQAFGIENIVLALNPDDGAMKAALAAISKSRLHIARIDVASRPGLARCVYRLCQRYAIRGVICHLFGVDHLVVGVAAKAARIPAIVVRVGNPAPSWTQAKKAAMKWVSLIHASAALGMPLASASVYVQQTLSALASLPAGSTVIYNGCDVRDISAEAAFARSKRKPDSPFTLGMVARLDPIKDHECLLKAFAILCGAKPGVSLRLDLVGDGVLRSKLQEQAHALKISQRVNFLGTRSDVPHCLGQFDLFAFATTTKEGFGIALIEALAAGLPVVATDVPACREVLRGGQLGELVPPRDSNALAAALARVIDMKHCGAESRQSQIEETFELYDHRAAAEKHLALMGMRG
jgi:glycosyltransferase involved in cell wall biosynthesis